MFAGIGILILIVMVFGGFVLTGGDIVPVLHALPHEMLIIGGAAIGAVVAGHDGPGLKALGATFVRVFKGPRYKKSDFLDAMLLIARLMRLLRSEGPAALEPHVEQPETSAIFADYPRLLTDHSLVSLICDTLRLVVVSSGDLDPHAVEDVIDNALRTHHEASMAPANSMQTLADALPALGIVAAVLGVVKTMGSIDKPPAVLGGMIGSALVGTFLGVLLSYGLVGPLATRARQVIESDAAMYDMIKQLIVASLHGHPQPLVIEAARSSLTHNNQPSFSEVFDGMRAR